MNGAQLRRVRVAAGLGQPEVARAIGQSQVWVSRLEARAEVHATTADIYLSGVEAILQRREERREQLARGLAELAATAGGR